MAEDVAEGLHDRPDLELSRCVAVTKEVGPQDGRLDSGTLRCFAYAMAQHSGLIRRSKGLLHTEEYKRRARERRAAPAYILRDRTSDSWKERKMDRGLGLAPRDLQPPAGPVDVLETKLQYLGCAEAVGTHQQKLGAISAANSRCCVNRLQ